MVSGESGGQNNELESQALCYGGPAFLGSVLEVLPPRFWMDVKHQSSIRNKQLNPAFTSLLRGFNVVADWEMCTGDTLMGNVAVEEGTRKLKEK